LHLSLLVGEHFIIPSLDILFFEYALATLVKPYLIGKRFLLTIRMLKGKSDYRFG